MTRGAAARFGIASVCTLPIFALGPPLLVMVLRSKSYPDFFYLSIAGAALSIVLCLIAAVKSRWWWIFAPLVGAAIVMVVYIAAAATLGIGITTRRPASTSAPSTHSHPTPQSPD
jgi:uncharacterized membrane protein